MFSLNDVEGLLSSWMMNKSQTRSRVVLTIGVKSDLFGRVFLSNRESFTIADEYQNSLHVSYREVKTISYLSDSDVTLVFNDQTEISLHRE